jgi:hypothetical protein
MKFRKGSALSRGVLAEKRCIASHSRHTLERVELCPAAPLFNESRYTTSL